jgi:hypothetical protein
MMMSKSPSYNRSPTPSPAGETVVGGGGSTMSTGAAVGAAVGASAVVLLAVAAAKMRRDGSIAARSGGYYWGQHSVNSSFVHPDDDNNVIGLGPNDTPSDEDMAASPPPLAGGYVEPRGVDGAAVAAGSTPTHRSTPPPWRSEPRDADGSPAMPSFEDGV